MDRIVNVDDPEVSRSAPLRGRTQNGTKAPLLGCFRAQCQIAACGDIGADLGAGQARTKGAGRHAARALGRIGQIAARIGRDGHAVEDLVEARHAEAGVVAAAQHQPVNRLIFGRDLWIGRGPKAGVIVDTQRAGHFEPIEHRHQHFGIGRLDRPVLRGQRVDVVKGCVEDVRRARRRGSGPVELIGFTAIIDTHGQLGITARQAKQRTRGRSVDLDHLVAATIERNALGRDCLQTGQGRIGLGQAERIEDTRIDQADQTRRRSARRSRCARIDPAADSTCHARAGRISRRSKDAAVMIASAEHRRAFAAGQRGPGAIVPALKRQRAFDPACDAEGLGVGHIFTAFAGNAAPAEADRLAIAGIKRRHLRRVTGKGPADRIEDRVIGRSGQAVQRIGDRQGRGVGRKLVVREALGRIRVRTGHFDIGFAGPQLDRALGIVGQGVDRLLQGRGAARVPGAGIDVVRRVPQQLVIGHAAIHGAAASAARQIQDVDPARGSVATVRRGQRQTAGKRAGGEEQGVIADVEHGRDRGPAGVNRQAALGLVAVDEITVRTLQDLVPAIGNRAHDVEALLIQVAITGHAREAIDVATTLLGDVREALDAQAGVVLLGDIVDNPADGIGTVDRRSAVLQHFNPVNRGEGDLVNVHRLARKAVGSDAATVKQDQRCRATLTTQVGRGKAIGAALRASGHV